MQTSRRGKRTRRINLLTPTNDYDDVPAIANLHAAGTSRFLLEQLSPPNSKNLLKIASPAYYKPIMMKDSILKDLNSKNFLSSKLDLKIERVNNDTYLKVFENYLRFYEAHMCL